VSAFVKAHDNPILLNIQRSRRVLFTAQAGDDEARIGAFLQMFGFAYHAAFSTPTLQCLRLKISEDPRRSARRFELLFRFRHLPLKQLLQSFVLGLAEEVINLVALAPGLHLVARKARIASFHYHS